MTDSVGVGLNIERLSGQLLSSGIGIQAVGWFG